LDMNVLEGIST